MRSALVFTLCVSLASTIACRRQESATPTDGQTDTSAQAPPAAISAAQLCDHLLTLLDQMAAESNVPLDGEQVAEFQRECQAEANADALEQGPQAFQVQAECVLATTKFDDLERCDPAEPNSKTSDLDVAPVCAHVFALMRADLGELVSFTDEENQEMMRGCVLDLEAKRSEMPAEQFEREVACVMAAKVLADTEACG